MSSKEEFGGTAADKEERKKQRKKRIEKNSVSEVSNNEDSSNRDAQAAKTGSQQVQESLFNLDKRKHSGLQDVTSIRVTTNDSEAKRRVDDEELRRSRLAKLQQEALASAKANAAIEMKWSELLEKDIPQELYQDIKLQQEACKSIIKSKDDLILDFQQQLRSKDEEYVRTLRQQAEDIDELLNRIRREFKELQHEYDKELDAIEEVYIEERDRLIAEHTSEIDSMFEHRRNKEIFYKEAKQKSEEQYQSDVDELITKGTDQYNKLKIELEMNIQALKQQLEDIRATYQLNTEKLDYNYRVLTELEQQKKEENAAYKRRINKLKEQAAEIKRVCKESEANDARLNEELTEEYRNLTLKYKDLQTKFRHFEIADTTKYDEVWTMHEEEVKDLVDQLLKADKIITEQQIGWKWRAPDMHALQHVLGRHGGLGLAANLDQSPDDEGGDGDRTNSSTADPDAEHKKKVAGARVRAVLKLLATEAGFMLNPQVQQAIEDMPDDEADLTRAETMLKALGVKSEERLNTLVNYFFRTKSTEELLKFDTVMEGDEEEQMNELLLITNAPDDVQELKDMIKPEDVIAAVKAYIEDVNVETGPAVTAAVGGSTKATQEEIRIAQKRLAAMRNYWVQLSQVVSDETVSVWHQLEHDCNNARELLSKRTESIAEVDALTKQNAELKKLLNQYLGDAVTNSAFKVPPAQTMKVREVTTKTAPTKSPKKLGKTY